jgi:hypothetical protein
MNKVRASALYFVLIISLLLFILVGLFIVYGKLQKQLFKQYEINLKLYDNVYNAQLLFTKDSLFRSSIRDSLQVSLYGETNDSVLIRISNWGFWDVVQFRADYNRFSKNRSLFFAHEFNKEDTMKAALYLRDKQNMLVIAGNTNIKGNCYLPSAGIKPGILEGKPYNKKELIFGKRFNSTATMPLVDSTKLATIISLLDSTYLFSKYKIHSKEITPLESIRNTFENPTKLIYLKGKQKLNNNAVLGNIILFSDEEITIDKNSTLEDVMVIAPIIRISAGFKGNAQFLSTDSLIVNESVILNYPTVLFNYQSEDHDGKIIVKRNAKINAAILGFDKSNEDKNAKVEIQKDVYLTGMIWVEGYLHFNANLSGYLFTNKFIWNTTASMYENHLLDANINSTEIPTAYLFPTIFPSKRVGLMKNLE